MEFSVELNYKQNQDKNSIVIIGAGPCGILSVRHLKDKANIICLDAKEDIGGMWHFDKYTEFTHPNLKANAFYNDNGVLHSSLYENLITNLPKFLMTYKGFPAKEEYDEFMTADQFYEYLQEYTNYHQLKKHILFSTYVQYVRLSKNLTQEEKDKVGFEVTKKFLIQISSADDYTKNMRYLQADSVIVASGHQSIPNLPVIEKEEIFDGHKIHMHYLREETFKEYTNKHLVVYGCSMSAQDVVVILLKRRELSQQPKKITVIGNPMMISFLQKSTSYKEEFESGKLRFVPSYIKCFDSKNSLELQSGERIEDIDCFLHTTGYQYSMPFLEKYQNVDHLFEYYNSHTRKNSFGPLYKKMFCISEPHLIFLGCLQNTISIQHGYERQAIAASQFVTDQIQLPTQQEMQLEFDTEISTAKTTNPDCRDFFKVSLFVGMNEILYFKSLANLSKMEYDNQFDHYLLTVLLPVYKQIFMNGEYPQLKRSVFSNQLPPNYSPPLNLF